MTRLILNTFCREKFSGKEYNAEKVRKTKKRAVSSKVDGFNYTLVMEDLKDKVEGRLSWRKSM